MSTIKTAISLQDDMSSVLNKIRSALDSMTGAWDDLEDSTERGLDNGEVEKFNKELEESSNIASDLTQKIMGIATAFLGVREVVNFVQDSMNAFDTQLNAQVQLAATSANMVGDAWEDAYDRILKKSSEIQSKGIYGDEAMIAAGAEFATYMTDTDAIEMMMDTLTNYAMGMTGGGALDSAALVSYATNLGKITTGAYDAMAEKGFEFTEAQKAVIDGSATEAQLVEALGDNYADLSYDMQAATVIADIINESWGGMYETMSNTPRGKIIQLQNAWGDLKEILAGQVYPAVVSIVDQMNANWGQISTVLSGFGSLLAVIVTILGWIVGLALNIASAIVDNWSIIQPIILAVATALTIFGIAAGISAIWSTAHSFAMKLQAASAAMLSGKTFAATAAQYGFNAALLACPITWIVIAVIALIALIYAVVAAINKAKGTTISATGIIAGVVMTLFSYIWNIVASFVNYFANVWTDPIGSIARLFGDLADTVLGLLEAIASGIDAVFGSNLASTVSGWRSTLDSAITSKYGDGIEVMTKMDSLEAFNSGYKWGKNVEDTVGDWFSGIFDGAYDLTDLSTIGDFSGLGGSGISDDLDSIDSNTGATANALDITNEDLKYLRDLAEQEAINRFTTAEIRVDMGGINNTVNQNADLDGIIDYMVTGVQEAMERVAEGVHN